jgi:hypothetical protein
VHPSVRACDRSHRQITNGHLLFQREIVAIHHPRGERQLGRAPHGHVLSEGPRQDGVNKQMEGAAGRKVGGGSDQRKRATEQGVDGGVLTSRLWLGWSHDWRRPAYAGRRPGTTPCPPHPKLQKPLGQGPRARLGSAARASCHPPPLPRASKTTQQSARRQERC